MIFLTVGTQLPFDRLVRAVDHWASENPGVEIFGQIGPAKYRPSHFRFAEFLPPDAMDQMFREAELIVAHAGVGTIVSALTLRTPIVVVPRRQALGEHRSDHQLATAQWLKDDLELTTVLDTDELGHLLDQRQALRPGREIAAAARPRLLQALREFVEEQPEHRSAFGGLASWLSALGQMVRDPSARANRHS